MNAAQGGDPGSEYLWGQLANAVALLAKQDQIGWTVFGIFWATQAVLAVALFGEARPRRWVGITVSLAGIVTSLVWSITQKRAIEFVEFYDALVHRLEERLLAGNLDLAVSGRLNGQLFSSRVHGMRARPLVIGSTLLFLLAWLVGFKDFLFFAPAG